MGQLLPFHRRMVQELIETDGLCVMAAGTKSDGADVGHQDCQFKVALPGPAAPVLVNVLLHCQLSYCGLKLQGQRCR